MRGGAAAVRTCSPSSGPTIPIVRRASASHLELDAGVTTSAPRSPPELYRGFRRQNFAGTLAFEDFIHDLQLVVEVVPLVPEDLQGSAQLRSSPNQSTSRPQARGAYLQRSSQRPHEIRTVRDPRRFGDYGLSGLVVAERAKTCDLERSDECRVLAVAWSTRRVGACRAASPRARAP